MKNQPRRQFIKNAAILTGSSLILADLTAVASTSLPNIDTVFIDASGLTPVAIKAGFNMGTAVSASGQSITLDSRSLLINDKPWVFISGEFHFTRCPAAEWRDELLKIKAGGVSLVTTYIFWIHHEEVEGNWDWTGQRDLRKFLQLCKEVDLKVLLRIGPWCHGEVRNGGFPDWLQKKGNDKMLGLRQDDPAYLAYAKQLYEQIAQQAKGLLWKDNGPVIGVQIENEYGGPAKHLMTLKALARGTGLDVPLYSCTGWGGGSATPFGEMVPFSGGYAEGFWDRTLSTMPGNYADVFKFNLASRNNATDMGALGITPAATDKPPASSEAYPFFTCEIGAGMMSSYHRRIFINPEDTESVALVKLGLGANLLGFYMYHGGQNPDGKLSYLNETQARGYWNDLPVKNYDFQSPIGEYGQQREPYRWLRQLALFLKDFGPGLSGMTARLPDVTSPLNCSIRSNGNSGFIFVSNYQRLLAQPKQENIQFRIKFANSSITVPSQPVTIPDNSRFFWPVNLDLDGIKLLHASAQPITKISDQGVQYTIFKQTAGVPAAFVFDSSTATVQSSPGKIINRGSEIHVQNVPPGMGAAIQLLGKNRKKHVILLLDEITALDLCKENWHGRERLFLSNANLLVDGQALRLRTEGVADCSVAIFPAPAGLTSGNQQLTAEPHGIFQRFSHKIQHSAVQVSIEKLQVAGPARKVQIAPEVPGRSSGMAMQPEDDDFSQAAVWKVNFPAGLETNRDLRLRIRYTGDVIRAYCNNYFMDDDFYNARPFEIGLRRYGPEVYKKGVMLKVLPLSATAPVYFTKNADLKFSETQTALNLESVEVIETMELKLYAI